MEDIREQEANVFITRFSTLIFFVDKAKRRTYPRNFQITKGNDFGIKSKSK
jgi:hypothetical protein